MKKLLCAALFALALPALLVSPAGAAVPSKPAKRTIACPDGRGAARVWWTVSGGRMTKLAVDNPCRQWLALYEANPHEASGAWNDELQVAPRTHFNWGKKRVGQYQGGVSSYAWHPEAQCGGSTYVQLVYRYNDVRSAEGIAC